MASQARLGGGEAIELGLRDLAPAAETPSTPVPPADQFRPLLDQAFSLIADCVAACGDADLAIGMIQECRASLMTAASPQSLIDRCATGLEACRQVLARHDATESARRRQMVELVELVREAMATVAGDQDVFDQSLSASASRFDALLRLDSLTLIKTQLRREIVELQRVTAERQRSWQATLTGFSTRIADLEEQLAESEQQAAADALTGLANRAVFDRTLKELAGRAGSNFSLALIDVDNFKTINDTWGHLAGDQVLIAVGQGLRSAFRAEDLVARHGGDEFAVIIKDVGMRQAETRMLSAIDALAANRPFTDAGETIVFSLSAGIAEFSAGDTTRSVIQRADAALYDAKRRGKNRVVRREQVYFRDLRARGA
jgi:diguanylate cyclase (GGDEF)-like protein